MKKTLQFFFILLFSQIADAQTDPYVWNFLVMNTIIDFRTKEPTVIEFAQKTPSTGTILINDINKLMVEDTALDLWSFIQHKKKRIFTVSFRMIALTL